MTSLTKQNMAWTAKKWTSGRVVQNNYFSVPSLMVCVSCIHLCIPWFFIRYAFVLHLFGRLVVRSFGHSVTQWIGHLVQSYYSWQAMRPCTSSFCCSWRFVRNAYPPVWYQNRGSLTPSSNQRNQTWKVPWSCVDTRISTFTLTIMQLKQGVTCLKSYLARPFSFIPRTKWLVPLFGACVAGNGGT
jgi:hypothetical protein